MNEPIKFVYHTEKISTELPRVLLEYVRELKDILEQNSEGYPYHDHLIKLARDRKIFAEAETVASKYKTKDLKYVIVVGIGGSNLGTKAIYDALRGQLDLLGAVSPKMLFADTISAPLLSDMITLLEQNVQSPSEIVINLVSKSGGTTESVANFELLYHALVQRFPNIGTRIIVTTDAGSNLWNEAQRLGFGSLPIPKEVGGRYSIFSSVGILPLLLANIDVESLLGGASEILSFCVDENIEKNPALKASGVMHEAHRSGAVIHNIFLFNPELESLGKWERQLIGESIGKERDIDGNVIRAGITPIVSIGSTDLHSMAQLYFGGPKDKFTMLVHAPMNELLRLPEEGVFHGLVEGLPGKTPNDIMQAIIGGVRAAYKKNDLPFMDVEFAEISPRSLGAYLMWRMITIMYLAKFLHVNAFDQPNVEDYKTTTKELLLGRA